ncbi:GAP family protein [Lysobacter silvisoli]|uniref:GAP family protein n=1 Tax=Lysobacter silvisoli TaxID=2293254 RepID=A0A371K6Q6_9GAMM|nr:GAP family protein [Lysobacter silvisoli]RDZ29542.1 GAP family protein [Lysobacter silvisoli]
MTDIALPVLGLAVVDSINPSALAVALWWMARPGAAPRLLAYIAGIAVAYLTLGIALMLGLGAAVQRFGAAFDHPLVLALQFALGLAMLGYGIFAPKQPKQAPQPRQPRVGGLLGMMLLGMTVTAVELVTALPYFAAIAVMTSAQLAWWQWLPLLLVYNAIFVAPPLLLLGLYVFARERLQDRFERWRESLQRGARETLLWIVAIVGIALAGDAVGRYLNLRDGTPARADAPAWWED